MSEEPEYLEHTNDPAHPAGNKEMAFEMFHAEDNGTGAEAGQLRHSAVDQRQYAERARQSGYPEEANHAEESARRDDESAERAEERERRRFLRGHLEPSQSSEPASEAAAEVGEVALSDDEHSEEGELDPVDKINQLMEDFKDKYRSIKDPDSSEGNALMDEFEEAAMKSLHRVFKTKGSEERDRIRREIGTMYDAARSGELADTGGEATQKYRAENWVDEETAREMHNQGYGNVKRQAERLRKNLQASGLESDSVTRTLANLENDAKEIAERAKKEIEQERTQEKANFEELREKLIGKMLGIASGEIEVNEDEHWPPTILSVDARSMRRGRNPHTSVWIDGMQGHPQITQEHVYELRELVYKMLGAEPPRSNDFRYYASDAQPYPSDRFLDKFVTPFSRFRQAAIASPGNLGFSVVERREAVKTDEAKGLERETEGLELWQVDLDIVPTKNSHRNRKAA